MNLYGNVIGFLQINCVKLVAVSKCGESALSVVPTVLWTAGAASLAHRLLSSLFRHMLFRRVQLWETILRHLLLLWMIMYSIHFWFLLVTVLKTVTMFIYEDEALEEVLPEELEGRKLMQQWVILVFSAAPLGLYLQTRTRPEGSPLMIWITTHPWQRREMGPYGYYLNRPLSPIQSSTHLGTGQSALVLRRAFSDSKILLQQPTKKRRQSKSI